MTDEELKNLKRIIDVVYRDEADAILPKLVNDLIAARAEIERLREIVEDPEEPYP